MDADRSVTPDRPDPARPAGAGEPSKPGDYESKRDFRLTPEPPGPSGQAPGDEDAGSFLRFVVQEHHARSLHWDLRLERRGVLRSWAIPKGPPLEPGTKRLAVEVEDHPLEYMDFEGVIPEGNYGAGTVTIWDHGQYALAEETADKLLLAMVGQRLEGPYYMVRTKGNQWLMWKLAPRPRPAP